MTDLINPMDYMQKTVHQHEMEKLQARIERLERFIMQGYDWSAMLTESTLNETIKHTVDHNMWIDVTAKLRGGDE